MFAAKFEANFDLSNFHDGFPDQDKSNSKLKNKSSQKKHRLDTIKENQVHSLKKPKMKTKKKNKVGTGMAFFEHLQGVLSYLKQKEVLQLQGLSQQYYKRIVPDAL